MHPQLADKKLGKCSSSVAFDPLTTTSVCKDFIQALEECHLSTWARFTGGCNKYKDAMNVCLHEESVARSARNRENAKDRQAKREEATKAFFED
ncbi:UPF0287-domain-containing protein [Gymnopus androsaceus JB14]|uniref:COX assembly mitochondrial protein n=1 Tax=Gymnopus androsaceus JB14 TaxID=1447944 RepID=A0A6A4I6U8_9AGAR|nr:UPF0287-domain-containing protein [Gymnopus androsaceus JB14]